MTKEELINEIEDYMHHIMWAYDCFNAYHSLMDGISQFYDEASMATTFFTVTQFSLISSMLLEVAKLFHEKEDKNLLKLIDLCKKHSQIFPDVQYYASWHDEQPINSLLDYLSIAQQDIANQESVLKKLRARRDQYYAHNDKEYFSRNAKLADFYPLGRSDIEPLLKLAAGLCNGLLAALDDRSIWPFHVDHEDLLKLLRRAHEIEMQMEGPQ